MSALPDLPVPPPTSREDALGRLRLERWHADLAGEADRVAELDRRIARLSARNSSVSPQRETTAAAPARPETTAPSPARDANRRKK